MNDDDKLHGLVASQAVLGAGLGVVWTLPHDYVLLKQTAWAIGSVSASRGGMPNDPYTFEGIEGFARHRSNRGPIAYLNLCRNIQQGDTSSDSRIEAAAWCDGEIVFGPERACGDLDLPEHPIIADALRCIGVKTVDGTCAYHVLELEKQWSDGEFIYY
jgi:hypothetical protein